MNGNTLQDLKKKHFSKAYTILEPDSQRATCPSSHIASLGRTRLEKWPPFSWGFLAGGKVHREDVAVPCSSAKMWSGDRWQE